MPASHSDILGVVATFGRGDLLTVLTSPTPDGPINALAILDHGEQHEIGAYHDIGHKRGVGSQDRVVAQLVFENRESLRVVIEQLEELDSYMAATVSEPHNG